MPEVAFREIYGEQSASGTFAIFKSLDASVRETNNELYIFRRETNNRFESLESDISSLKKDVISLQQDNVVLKNDVSELKNEVKELRRDVSDIKGDIKALAAGFGATQSRFNWGLVILGIIVALIQLLK